MRSVFVLTFFLSLISGCGPVMIPTVQRLSEEEQRKIDSAWNNMLSPVGRLDRQTLLDTLVTFQFHQNGVDRLVLRSEKSFSGGTAVMEIHYERANAKMDRFDISVYDADWNLQRRESYRPDEIARTVHELFAWEHTPLDKDGKPLPLPPEEIARRQAREARQKAIIAATQPAAAGQ